MVNIAICDDDIEFMEMYAGHIKDIFSMSGTADEKYAVVKYCSGKNLLDNYKNDGIDIFLLDIDLGDCKGYEVGRELTLRETDPAIIYITGYSENVYSAFVGRPIGFVRKEFFDIDLAKFVYDAVYHIQKKKQIIVINEKDMECRLTADEIVVVEVFNHELSIILKDGQKTIKGSLCKYEDKLKQYGFIKISRSVMLNPRYIKNISGDEVIMTNNRKYNVSRGRRKNVRGKYELCTKR